MVRILLSVFLYVSCAIVHPSGRRPQASDQFVGGSHLVKAAYRATLESALRLPVTTARKGLPSSGCGHRK